MRFIIYTAICIVVSATPGKSQSPHTGFQPPMIDSVAIKYAETITESDLKNYISILASDALEGRNTGSRGQKMAAAFIREHFKDNNLLPIVHIGEDSLYFQKLALYRNYLGEVYIENQSKKFQHLNELVYIGNAAINLPQESSLQFVGEGEEKDYQNLDVDGSMVAFYASNADERQRKIRIARELGAYGFVIINSDDTDEFKAYVDRNAQYFEAVSITRQPNDPGNNILFLTNAETVADLLGIDLEKVSQAVNKAGRNTKNPYKKMRSNITLKVEKISEKFETENVLGLVEGTDRKDELIVITAHYDHVGKAGENIYNGADDDASGTAAVMELAQAFSIAKKAGHSPRRSLLFMTVTGEEKGLLGSEYYSNNPEWPLEQTIANLNIDMIGRVDPEHEENPDYVYIIGADRLSKDLHLINEQVNMLYTRLKLDYRYNAPDDPNRFYYRSDHYNFAKHNIPIVFYFNGTHEDYHQPTDTIDKIRFDLLKKRGDLVFYCAWELANREERIRLNQ